MVVFAAYLIPIPQTGLCNFGPSEILIVSNDFLLTSPNFFLLKSYFNYFRTSIVLALSIHIILVKDGN